LFLFLRIWYFVFPLASVVLYLRYVSTIVFVFYLPFNFCNSVFAFRFCNCFVFWSNCIALRRYLFSFCNLVLCLSLLLRSDFLCLLIMATEKDDSLQLVSVRLDGKNYLYWSYVIRNFIKGKKMWGYVSGTYVIPKNTEEGDATLIDRWKANKAKIITWINNFVEHFIGM